MADVFRIAHRVPISIGRKLRDARRDLWTIERQPLHDERALIVAPPEPIVTGDPPQCNEVKGGMGVWSNW